MTRHKGKEAYASYLPYDHLAQQKKLLGIFKGIPHVMVQGPIPIAQVRTIRWGEPPI